MLKGDDAENHEDYINQWIIWIVIALIFALLSKELEIVLEMYQHN